MTTINYSSQYMQNYKAASALNPQDSFAVAKLSDGGALVLSIDETGSFRATAERSGHETGWASVVIGPNLAATYPGLGVTTKSFAVSQLSDTGTLTILLVLSVGTGSKAFDVVYLLAGLETSVDAAWLSNPAGLTWTARAFDAGSAMADIAAATLRVADVYMDKVFEQDSAVNAIVTLVDPNGGKDQPFTVSTEPAANPVWSYVKPPVSYDTVADMALGQPRDQLIWGFYLLGAQNSQPFLGFLPIQTALPADRFTVPAGATAIATLPLNVGGRSYTDLFVAGTASLTLFPYDDSNKDANNNRLGIVLSTSPLLTGATDLHALTDGTTVLVWALNGQGQVFYLSAPYARRTDPTAWTQPLPLLSGVLEAAPFLSDTTQVSAIFTVTKDAQDGTTAMTRLARPTSGGAWNQTSLLLPATGQYIALKTYTTSVSVLDDGGTPLAKTAVTVTASTATVAEINGLMYRLAPGLSATVTTDAAGCLTLAQPVSTLAASQYTLTASSVTLGPIDPTQELRQTLSKVQSSSDLTNTTNQAGQPFQLVPPGPGTDADKLQAVASAIKTLNGISLTTDRVLQTATMTLLVQSSGEAAAPAAGEGFLVELGDLVQHILNGLENAFDAVVQVVDNAWNLVVTIGSQVFRAVINTVEDVVNTIVAVLKQIAVDIEKAFQWLAFFFDWSDILAVRDALKALYTSVLNGVATTLSGVEDKLDAWFGTIEALLKDSAARQAALQKVGTQSARQAWQSNADKNTTVKGVNLQNSAQTSWVRSQMPNFTGATRSAGTALAAAIPPQGDPSADFATALEKIGAQMEATFASLGKQVGQVVDGQINAQQFLASVGNNFETLGVEVAQDVVDAALSAAVDAIKASEAAINTTIQIPLLSALYKDIASDKDDSGALTFLDATCLIQSVVMTLGYKIATNKTDLAEQITAVTSGSVQPTLAKLASLIPAPGTKAPTPATLAMAAMAMPAGHAATVLATTAGGTGEETGDTNSGGGLRESLIGLMRLIRTFTLVGVDLLRATDDAAEGAEAALTSAGNIVYFIDLTARLFIAVMELIEVLEDKDRPTFKLILVIFEFAYALIATLFVGVCLAAEGSSKTTAGNSLLKVDWAISSIFGFAGLMESIVDECNTGDVLYSITELAELASHFSEKEPEVAPLILGARALCCYASGVAAMIDAG